MLDAFIATINKTDVESLRLSLPEFTDWLDEIDDPTYIINETMIQAIKTGRLDIVELLLSNHYWAYEYEYDDEGEEINKEPRDYLSFAMDYGNEKIQLFFLEREKDSLLVGYAERYLHGAIETKHWLVAARLVTLQDDTRQRTDYIW